MAILMRMSVLFGGLAMRRPTGMCDACGRFEREIGDLGFEFRHPADRLDGLQSATRHKRDAGAVIPAVLEPSQTLDEQFLRLSVADRTDDSTHRGSG